MMPGLFSFLEKVAAEYSQPQHEDFLDEHFSISPQWKAFRKKTRAKSFVEAVRQDTRSDEKLKRYSEANGKHLRARGVPAFKVLSQSSNKDYTVKYHADDGRFSCSCGDWIHARSHQTGKSRQDCKHIKSIKAQLERAGKTPEAMMKKAAMGRATALLLGWFA
jgi:predicted nucleic acid-binding Zn finger protein